MKDHNQPFRLGDKVVVQGGNTFDTSGAVKTEGIVLEVNESWDNSPLYTVVTPYKFPNQAESSIFCGCKAITGTSSLHAFDGLDLYSTNAVPSPHQKLLARDVDISNLRVLGNLKER